MGSFSKRLKRVQDDNMVSEDNSGSDDDMVAGGEEEYDTADGSHGYNDYDEDSDDNERPSDGEEGDYDQQTDDHKDDEMEELEKEYRDLQNREKSLVESLKRHKDEDVLKGQAVKSQKALWDKTLELRFLLQKAFSNSNKLPQEPFRSLFCESNEGVSAAYSDLIASSKKTMDSLVDLQKAVLDNNPSIEAAMEGESGSSLKQIGASDNLDAADDEEWIRIAQMHSRIVPFRNKSVDKWQRKAEVNSGAAAKKGKLLAFNQNISEQVAMYMRDPSKMIKGMQMRRETVGVFGSVAEKEETTKEEGRVGEGDPELLDDLEFYQQLLKEFFDTVNPTSSETAFYALKKLQTKKRKVVDRRASKSRKIRYHVHEKIVNFMAPQPMELPPMAPKLFENLFGLRTQRPVSAT